MKIPSLKNSTLQFRQLGFLLLMLSFAFAVSVISWGASIQGDKLAQKKSYSASSDTPAVQFDSNKIAQVTQYNPVEVEQVVKKTDDSRGQVLSAGNIFSPVGSCTGGGYKLPLQQICSKTSSSVSLRDGIGLGSNRVRANSKIEVWAVSYPRQLFDGLNPKKLTASQFDKCLNRKEIDADNNCFLPIGELFQGDRKTNSKYNSVNAGFAPNGKTTDQNREYLAAGRRAVIANVNAGGAENQDASKSTFELNKTSDPDRSNKIAQYVGRSVEAPGRYVDGRVFDAQACERVDTDSLLDFSSKSEIACISRRGLGDIFKAIALDVQQLNQCLTDPNANCSYEELLYIKVDAPTGSALGCSEGFCATKGLSYTALGIQSPGSRSSYTLNSTTSNQPVSAPYYVKSKCSVRINVDQVVPVYCIWDITVYKQYYEMSAAEKPAGALPPFEEYLESILNS